MKSIITLIFILTGSFAIAQKETNNFKAHSNLIGGVWKTEALWKDGTPHNLHVNYSLSLNGTLLKTKTYGLTNNDSNTFGLRNEGVRFFNKKTNTIEFFEFDIFGGLTKGKVKYIDNNIFYTYNYDTGTNVIELTDGWEFVNKDKYKYKIGEYDFDTKSWKTLFLEAEMIRFNE